LPLPKRFIYGNAVRQATIFTDREILLTYKSIKENVKKEVYIFYFSMKM